MPAPITVLGIGNPIMGDDAIGPTLLARLRSHYGLGDESWIPSENPTFHQRGQTAPSAHPAPPSSLGIDPSLIEFVAGEISGMEMLPTVSEANKLLLLDAVAPIEPTQRPGDIVLLHGDQIARLLQAKLSPHQVGFLDVLTAGRLLGQEPSEIAVVGIIPAQVDLEVGFSPAVEAALDGATTEACRVIDRWLAEITPEGTPCMN